MKKRYIILLIILTAGISLTVWKWNTWFGNPPEAAYTTPRIPGRITLTVGKDAGNTRRINWQCDTLLTEAFVEIVKKESADTLRIEAEGEIVESRSGKSAFYSAEIQGLTPGAAYDYRVHNKQESSDWFTFRIPTVNSGLSFIYIGDIQDHTQGSTGEFFKEIHHQHPDVAFWALGGDVIERPTDEYWKYWHSTMDSIAGYTPFVAATGNHEYLKGAIKTLDPRWIHTFSNPGNGPKGFTGRSYSLDFEDLCYIVIDTDGIQGPQSLYRHRAWLKQVLATTTKKWKIVMMHHPVYSVRDGRNNYYVRWTFKPLFEKYDVNLVLQGHDHGYSRITTKTDDQQKQCPVYIVSSSSPKSYNIGFNPIHDRLGSNQTLYQHIMIQGDSLQFKTFTPDHEAYDDLTIVNTGNGRSQVIDHAASWPESLELPPAYRNGKVNLEKYQEKVKEREERKKD